MLGIRCRLAISIIVALAVHGTVAQSYHSLGDVLHFYSHTSTKQPQLLKFVEARISGHGQTATLPIATITNFTLNAAEHAAPTAILVFGEHAREVITTEVGVWLSKVLLGEATNTLLSWPETRRAFEDAEMALMAAHKTAAEASAAGDGHPHDEHTGAGIAVAQAAAASRPTLNTSSVVELAQHWSTEILNGLVLQILPIENMDGRVLLEGGDLCRRKSASGVDLNRNWPFAWKKEDKTSEVYGGPEPFSEPQSRMLRELAHKWRPKAFINVHSGEWAVYTPWDSKASLGQGQPWDLAELIQSMGQLCDCQAGPAGAVSNYLAYGTSMDYFYHELKTPYTLTLEVYGNNNEGKLKNGRANKPLREWPVEQVARRRLAAAAAGEDAAVAAGATAAAAAGRADAGRSSQSRWPLLAQAAREQRMSARRLRGAQGAAGTAAGQRRGLRQDAAGPQDDITKLVQRSPQGGRNCFDMFNPMDEATYRDVVARWVVNLMVALRHVADPTHPLRHHDDGRH